MSLRIPPEQRARIWERSKGRCECGCGKPMVTTSMESWPELHHVIPLGMGGRPKKVYQDHELRFLRLECHDLEESQGYPHRQSWVEEMKAKS